MPIFRSVLTLKPDWKEWRGAWNSNLTDQYLTFSLLGFTSEGNVEQPAMTSSSRYDSEPKDASEHAGLAIRGSARYEEVAFFMPGATK